MKTQALTFYSDFRVVFESRGVQAAEMVLPARGTEGGPDNRHRGAEQWLYVVSGAGEANVEDQIVPLQPGTLLLIERGERHTVRNKGDAPLKTLNFYAPPAYDAHGEELPAGEN